MLEFRSPLTIVFLVLSDFSLLELAAAIDVMHTANDVIGWNALDWSIVTLSSPEVRSSSGTTLIFDKINDIHPNASYIFICGGGMLDVPEFDCIFRLFQQYRDYNTTIGSLGTGSLILARLGFLSQHRCSVHSREVESIAQHFPDVDIAPTLFERDRDILTCAGGTATVDLLLNIVAKGYAEQIAVEVADRLAHPRVRDGFEPHNGADRSNDPATSDDVLMAISIMKAHQRHPLGLQEIAKLLNLSARQLADLFKKQCQIGPSRFYLNLRLMHAQELVLNTSLPLGEICQSVGFRSRSHFSKIYQKYFCLSPSIQRLRSRDGTKTKK